MKKIISVLGVLSVLPNFAMASYTYTCKGSTPRAILRIVDSRWAGPQIQFYPEGNGRVEDTRGVWSSSVSKLRESPDTNFLSLDKTIHLGIIKELSTLSVEKGVLQGASEVEVLEHEKTVTVFRGKVIAAGVNQWVCTL